jgi:hypothetical protein
MPLASVRQVISAPAAEVFDLLHDYSRRMEWDTLLSAAWIDSGHDRAGRDVVTVCRGRWMLGGLALRTRYIIFRRGEVAAVRLLDHAPFFERWAASIRHRDLGTDRSEIVYTYNFVARPRWLRWLLHPVIGHIFLWETRKRLHALAAWFGAAVDAARAP